MHRRGAHAAHRAGPGHLALTLALVVTAAGGLAACDRAPTPGPTSEQSMPTLTPLSPRTHEFDTPTGRARNDYFTVDTPRRDDPRWRADLLRLLREQHHALGTSAPPLHSVYVYARTERLNPQFGGSADDLRGIHDHDLVAFGRWMQGQGDIAWLIEKGDVVRDLITDQPQEPPFEFD